MTTGGTPAPRSRYNFGFWHINDLDELYLTLPSPRPGDPAYMIVIMQHPDGTEGECFAEYCEVVCLTLMFERHYNTAGSVSKDFFKANDEAIIERRLRSGLPHLSREKRWPPQPVQVTPGIRAAIRRRSAAAPAVVGRRIAAFAVAAALCAVAAAGAATPPPVAPFTIDVIGAASTSAGAYFGQQMIDAVRELRACGQRERRHSRRPAYTSSFTTTNRSPEVAVQLAHEIHREAPGGVSRRHACKPRATRSRR